MKATAKPITEYLLCCPDTVNTAFLHGESLLCRNGLQFIRLHGSVGLLRKQAAMLLRSHPHLSIGIVSAPYRLSNPFSAAAQAYAVAARSVKPTYCFFDRMASDTEYQRKYRA